MTKKIKSTSQLARTIVSTSKKQRSIDQAQAAKSLGADNTYEIEERALSGSPPALFALRQELYRRLRSTGGRRSLEGATKRHKIPLIEGDWERLEQVAKDSEDEGIRPTPAQVASLLLHRVLKELRQEVESE